MAKTIVFETVNPAYEAEHIRVEIRPHNPVTQCQVSRQFEPVIGKYWQPLAEGMSVCKHGDAYDLETGCRLALISALRKVREKAIRRAVWVEYLKLFPVSSRTPPRKVSRSNPLYEALSEALTRSVERSLSFHMVHNIQS